MSHHDPTLDSNSRYDPDCVFCDHQQIATPVHRHVASRAHGGETFWVYTFMPLRPVTEGHLLVIPGPHVVDVSQDPDLSAGTLAIAARVAATHEHVNVITSRGRHATQSVKHLHFHVVPRREGDGLRLPWDPPRELGEDLPR